MLAEKSFDTGEITINYAEGPAVGSPLVMLHGFTGWWRIWQGLIPYLMQDWHIYACDLRGHGKSGRDGNDYRLTDYVGDTVAFLRHHATQPAILFGRSWGGVVALGAAAEVPQHVRALVLVDPSLLIWRAGLEALPNMQSGLRWLHETLNMAHSYADVVARCKASMPEAMRQPSRRWQPNCTALIRMQST